MRPHTILHLFALLAFVELSYSSDKPSRRHKRHGLIRSKQDSDLEPLLDSKCLRQGFKAPFVPYATAPRYIKRIHTKNGLATQRHDDYYLLAVYECQSGHRFFDGQHGVMYCSNGKWIGARPICIAEISTKGSIQADQTNALVMETEHPRKCSKCHHPFEECILKDDNHWKCACKRGFKRINGVCTDINECKALNKCEHLCTNLLGTYYCRCKPGYRLLPNGESCEDINECLLRNGHGPCEDTCVNLLGSYICSCNHNGTTLSLDAHTCDDVNECKHDTSGCSHGCINTRGKAYCSCPDGMMLDSDWKTCVDKPYGDQPGDEYYDENEDEDEYIDAGEGGANEDYDEEEEERRDYDEEERLEREELSRERKRMQAAYENEKKEKLGTERESKEDRSEEAHVPETGSEKNLLENSNNNNVNTSAEDGGSDKVVATIRDLEESTDFHLYDENNYDDEEEGDYEDRDQENSEPEILQLVTTTTTPTITISPTSTATKVISVVLTSTVKTMLDSKEEGTNEKKTYSSQVVNSDELEKIEEETLKKSHIYQLGNKNNSNNTQTASHLNRTNPITIEESTILNIHQVKTNQTIEDTTNKNEDLIDKNIEYDKEETDLIRKHHEKDEYDEQDQEGNNKDSVLSKEVEESVDDEYDEETWLEPKGKINTTPTTATTSTSTTITTILIPATTTLPPPSFSTSEITASSTTTESQEITTKFTLTDNNKEISGNSEKDDDNENDYEYVYEEYEDNEHDNNVPIPRFTTQKPSLLVTELPTRAPEISVMSTGQKLCKTGYKLNENFDCVDINECEDPEHGCSDLCENTVGSYQCSCPSGFETTAQNKYTCSDIDECAIGTCSHDCFNAPGSFSCECPSGWILRENTTCYEIKCQHGFNLTDNDEKGYVCLCSKGYFIDSDGTCSDINECLDENLCEHECKNIQGSYECTCKPGYTSIENNCDDINECLLDNAGCQQLCANLEGSYECGCQVGYYLDTNNKTCLEIDNCEDYNGNCSDICRSIIDGVICECRHGRELEDDNKTCRHFNPCHVDNGGCSHDCVYKEEYGVQCECPRGHQLLIDARTCEEINPCLEENGGCSHLCITGEDDPLEAVCKCPDSSYILQNKTCFKMNPCMTDNGGCSHECHFDNDEVRCACPETYQLFGKVCQKRNLCEENNGECSHFCNFVNDSIICECPRGFELNGKTCQKTDPCLIENGGCSHMCISEDYEVECHCPINYELTADEKTCKAVDPCYNNGGCSHYCLGHQGRALCYCPLGYEIKDEKNCVEVNPCLENNGNCSHTCENKLGKAECQCPLDLILVNSTNCVNKCSINNGGCSHECILLNNEVTCRCFTNYELLPDGRVCKQVDPCRIQNGGCSHSCHSVDGQVVCQCPESDATTSYELIGKTCKLIDPCFINNGGCSHICVTINQKAKCECPPKYTLHEKVCFENMDNHPENTNNNVDLCTEQNGGCSHNCTVSNGVRECTCPDGFVLRPNKKTCKDINECMWHNGGCSHTCRNTPGSYKCLCPKGFRLQPNNKTCVTGYINECVFNNGGCQQICKDLKPGRQCSCQAGYDLQQDGQSCKEASSFFECHVKSIKNGRVKCTIGGEGDYVQVGSQCLYNCDKGFKLVGESLRTCEYSGEWDLKEPICSAFGLCPKLAQPLRGRIIPHICSTGKTSIGQTCGIHCRSGHKLINPEFANFSCEANEGNPQWSIPITEEVLKTVCVQQELPKPFIRCPSGGKLSYILPQGARVMTVKINRPESNVDWWRFVDSVPSWGKQLSTVLPPGRFDVIFTATSPQDYNVTSSCTLTIYVKDEEPPRVYNCPTNQEIRLERGEYSKEVYWDEPRFEDNIGIRTVYKSKKSGTLFSYGLHHVNYIASDDAGNRGYCHFSINVVNYYQQEYSSSKLTTRYRSVLICPHGVQYMSNTPDNYDNSITSENGCKWTYIRLRDQMGQSGYRMPSTSSYHHRSNQIRDIPYITPTPPRRHLRERFQWCC